MGSSMSLQSADNFYALVVVYGQGDDGGAALGRLGAMTLPNVRLVAAVSAREAGAFFSKAEVLGCTHVIAIHPEAGITADCLMPVLLAAGQNPAALIIGRRSTPQPARSIPSRKRPDVAAGNRAATRAE